MKNVFVCQTIKHLYVSIYASFYFSRSSGFKFRELNSLIFLCIDHQHINEELINVKALSDLGIEVVFISETELIEEFSSGSIFYFSALARQNISVTLLGIKTISKFLEKKFKKLVCNNDAIYLFHDRTLLSKYFLKLSNVSLIEDGLANYSKVAYRASALKKIIRFIKGHPSSYYLLGESESIKNIYLFKLAPVPELIRNKVTYLDQKIFYSSINVRVPNKLFMFNLPEQLHDIGSYDVVLLTQGLDVAGLCSEQEKLKIYTDLVSYLSERGLRTVLKMHPSERKGVYDELKARFNIDVIVDKIPIEALAQSVKGNVISLRTSAESFIDLNVFNLISSESDWKCFNPDNIRCLAFNNLKKFYES